MSSILALDEVVLEFVQGGRILDVGCGRGKWGHLVRIYRDWPRRGKHCDYLALEPLKIVGVDLSRQNLFGVKSIYDAIIECDGVCLPFRSNSFDTVIAAETIEHIPKPSAWRLIVECERVTRRVVIITTPPPRTVGISPEHISSWVPSDFQKNGYRVYGVRCYPRFASKKILVQLLIAFIIGPISYWFPELGSGMVAVKSLSKQEEMLFIPGNTDEMIDHVGKVLSLSKQQLTNIGMELIERVSRCFNKELIKKRFLDIIS